MKEQRPGFCFLIKTSRRQGDCTGALIPGDIKFCTVTNANTALVCRERNGIARIQRLVGHRCRHRPTLDPTRHVDQGVRINAAIRDCDRNLALGGQGVIAAHHEEANCISLGGGGRVTENIDLE